MSLITKPELLCSSCLNRIFNQDWAAIVANGDVVGEKSWPHHSSYRELELFSQTCTLCARVKEELVDDELLPGNAQVPFSILLTTPPRHLKFRYEVNRTHGGSQVVLEANLAVRFNKDSNIFKGAIWSCNAPILFDQRWHFIQDSLQECECEHTECKNHGERTALPTRLIQLALRDDTPPRLLETSALDLNTPYTTLSYRWGDTSKPPQTLLSNLAEHCVAIPANNLPKTFRDAMKITRKLGIRYIWIDSLCIIQDSADDWEHEAARMCDVYSGSHLNIAAIDSINADGGCFLDPMKSSFAHVSPKTGETIHLRIPYANERDVTNSTLVSRGWVFQELVLAPRVLYCGRNQMYWQCRTLSWSEDKTATWRSTLCTPSNASGRPPNYTPNGDWIGQMGVYSERRLTYEKDRLPAIAGVIEWFKQTYGMTPFLGLWKEHLAFGLAWMAKGEAEARRQGLPSWTWLSLDRCAIQHTNVTEAIECLAVFHAQLQWVGRELISDLKSSKLIARGFLFDFLLQDKEVLAVTAYPDLPYSMKQEDTSRGIRCFYDQKETKIQFSLPVWRTGLLVMAAAYINVVRLQFLILEAVPSRLPPAVIPKYKRIGTLLWDIGIPNLDRREHILPALAYFCDCRIDEPLDEKRAMVALEGIFRITPVVVELV